MLALAINWVRNLVAIARLKDYASLMILDYQDYRLFLKTYVTEKSDSFKGTSLRAFSERLQISNSFLSEVISGKKCLSVELAFKIAVKLNLNERETQYLCLLVQLENEKDMLFREQLQKRLKTVNPKLKSQDLSIDLFRIVSDWYHLAILELTKLTAFKMNHKTISEKLKISKDDALLALERMTRLELIEKRERGYVCKTENTILAESTVPNGAFKKYHGQILSKAIESLHSQAPSERISATDVVAIDSKFLPEVDRLSRQLSIQIHRLSEKSKFKNNVYALSVHFFNLTPPERKF